MTMLDMAMLDNLRHGAEVLSTDGHEVGKLHTVLLDGRDETITRVVVNAGPHFPAPGFGTPELIAVPVEEVADAQENKLILKVTREKFRDMPQFADYSLQPPPKPSDVEGMGLFDVAVALGQAFASIGGIPIHRETFRRAEFERHLFNDAPVWRNDPHEQIGEVEHVLVDEQDEEIEAIVVRRGEVLGDKVILPIDYVSEVFGGIVRVDITDEQIEALEEYEEG